MNIEEKNLFMEVLLIVHIVVDLHSAIMKYQNCHYDIISAQKQFTSSDRIWKNQL